MDQKIINEKYHGPIGSNIDTVILINHSSKLRFLKGHRTTSLDIRSKALSKYINAKYKFFFFDKHFSSNCLKTKRRLQFHILTGNQPGSHQCLPVVLARS